MALALEKELDTGVKISYLRISRVIVDRKNQSIAFDIEAFLDQNARMSDKKPVISYQYIVDDVDAYNIINKMDIIGALYGVIKNLPDFEGAQDA